MARERTGLAWERSAFSYAALAALLLGIAAHRHAPALLAASGAMAAVAAAVWRHGRRLYDRRAVAAESRVLALVAAATAAAAVVAAIIVVV